MMPSGYLSQRWIALAILSGLCAWAQEPASVRGRTVDSQGKPVSRVHVRLAKPEPNSASSASYGALSDDSGWFSMASIPPGTYLLKEIGRASCRERV